MKYQDHYFEVESGVQLRYLDEGTGPAILFVPGWCFSADVFVPLMETLTSSYRCIAVDPRCHGKSTVTYHGNRYDQQGRDLAALLETLKLKKAVLAGWSFGALACWSYVRQFGTQKVAGVVTFDNSPRSISEDPLEYRAGTLEGLQSDHWGALCTPEAFRNFMGGFADGLLYEGQMAPELRQELIESACRVPFEVADQLYMDGWLADERKTVHLLDETVPSLLLIANYRKDPGEAYMRKQYPHTEIHAFGMHMMFHEYVSKTSQILIAFLHEKIGETDAEWTK